MQIVQTSLFSPFLLAVTFISGNFLEGSDLELVCSMTKGNYSNVKLLKTDVASSREILLATFTSDGRDLVEAAFSRAATASREILPAPVTGLEFKLTLGGAVCSDDGEYFCRHDNGQTTSGLVDIKSMVVVLCSNFNFLILAFSIVFELDNL